LGAVAITVPAAGCGGSDKEQVSVTELVQKGDQICRTEQAKFAQIQAHPLGNAADATDQTKALIAVAEDASSDLGKLQPPDALRPRLDAYLQARDRAIDQLKKGQDAAEEQDSRAYGVAQTAVVRTSPQRRKLARAVGFKVCGEVPGSA